MTEGSFLTEGLAEARAYATVRTLGMPRRVLYALGANIS
jgi:hypothetical protein